MISSKLTSSTIAIGIVVISLLALLAWWSLAYRPGQTSLENLRTEIGTFEQQKTVGLKAQADIGGLCSDLAKGRAQQRAFLVGLPRTEKFSELLSDLGNYIKDKKGSLQSIARSASSATTALPQGVRSIDLRLGMASKFEGFYGILRSIENMKRFSKVETVNLSMDGEPSSYDPDLKTELSMTAYVYDNPQTKELDQPDPLCSTVSLSGGTR